MLRLTIKTKKHGTINFYGPGYIRTDLRGENLKQICAGGKLSGYTLIYDGDDDARFARICRRWWRNYQRKAGGQ